MLHAISTDGTPIGYNWLSHHGPAVILVGGGLDDGTENLPLGEQLATRFAVVNYRRRGRGDSGDVQPYSVQREIEDLAAVIDAVGGPRRRPGHPRPSPDRLLYRLTAAADEAPRGDKRFAKLNRWRLH